LKDKLGSKFDLNDDNMVDNNLLKMDIYYKEFNFENIIETPGYVVSILHLRMLLIPSYILNMNSRSELRRMHDLFRLSKLNVYLH